MDEPFNPYYKWLGIPLRDQPADHYRLLGIERFEPDPEVISHAADQRMAHIKSLSSGKYARMTQELLNEISAARVCLLNPESKAAYDAALWQRVESERLAAAQAHGAPFPLPAQPLGPVFAQPVHAPHPAVAVAPAAKQPGLLTRLSGQLGLPAPILGALALGTGLIVVVLVMVMTRPEPETVAESEPSVQSGMSEAGTPDTNTPPSKPSGLVAPGVGSAGLKVADPPAATPKKPSAGTKTGSAKAEASAEKPSEAPASKSSPETTPLPGDDARATPPNPPPHGNEDAGTGKMPAMPEGEVVPAATRSPEETSPHSAGEMRPAKAPVPDRDAQAKAEKQIRQMYRPDEVTEIPKRVELSKRLLTVATETQDDPAARFVLMRMAWLMAAEVGQLDRALEIIDQMGALYDADTLEYKTDVLERANKAAGTGPQALAFNQQLAEITLALTDIAIREDDYRAAARMLDEVALPAARRTKDRQLIADVTKRKDQLKRLKDEAAHLEKALATLNENDDDPEANLVVGRWHCLAKGQWDDGLARLAQGSDQALAGLARQDLQAPTAAPQQVELGDAWAKQADAYAAAGKETEAANLRARAAFWYRRALPSLAGLSRDRVAKYLSETAAGAPGDARPHYVLEFDGRQSHAIVPFGYDGTVPITIEAIVLPLALTAAGGQAPSVGTVIGNLDQANSSGLAIWYNFGNWNLNFGEVQRSPRGSEMSRLVRVGVRSGVLARNVNPTWTHVAAVFDLRQLRLYVNGELEASQAVTGRHKPTTKYPFVIGATVTSADASTGQLSLENHFRGLIKAVRISGTARYTDSFKPPSQLTRDDVHTHLLLVFDKGTGDVVEDTSGRKLKIPMPKGRGRAVTTIAQIVHAKWVQENGAEEPTKPAPNPLRPSPVVPDPASSKPPAEPAREP